MLKQKIKNFFKLNTWKRWFILIFSFIFLGSFIGLSYGLKSHNTKFSNDYKNGISLIVKPIDQNGYPLEEELSKNVLNNVFNRLENDYSESLITYEYQQNNVWQINVTDVKNKDELLENVLLKKDLTITLIDAKVDSNLFQSTLQNNNFFNYVNNLSGNNYTFTILADQAKNFVDWAKTMNLGNKFIIWKNYDILLKIVENAINNENFTGSVYEYLFINGITPENAPTGEGATTQPVALKDFLILESEGKTYKYKPSDFLVSKNNLSELSSSSSQSISLNVSKDFAENFSITNQEVKDEYYDIDYWISSYDLSNSIIFNSSAKNGKDSFLFISIALISFFSILTIFVVINYGYLGIFAIFIMAIIIFMSLLMISVFFGDYDTTTIMVIFVSAIISLDFIVMMLETFKKQFLKGNSLSKSIKNSIKKISFAMFLKSFLLIASIAILYSVLSLVFAKFSLLILITSILIPVVLIPLLIFFSRILVEIPKIGQSPKLVGLWKSKYLKKLNINKSKNDEIEKSLGIDETIETSIDIDNILDKKIEYIEYKSKQIKKFNFYKNKVVSKSKFLILTPLLFIIIFGLFIFLYAYFKNGGSFKNTVFLNPNDKNLNILSIGKKDNSIFTSEEINLIKDIFNSNGIILSEIKVINDSMIQAFLANNFSADSINNISLELFNLMDVIIIPSQLISSSTFKIMQFSLYAILIAIVVVCLFVLIWMKWTKAISLLITLLISSISFFFMLGFGFFQFDYLISIASVSLFLLITLSSATILINIDFKLKSKRIEELTKNDIKELVYKQSFKSIKSIAITNLFFISIFVLVLIMFNSIPFTFSLFMIGMLIVNNIFVLFLLPILIIQFETFRAKWRRKIILENYWDTEKIKEQTFKGINNIK